MTTREINALLALRGKTVAAIARAIGEERSYVAHVIGYTKHNKRVRLKIANHLGMPVDELFDAPPPSGVSAAPATTTA